MAQLPPDGKFLIQLVGGTVVLFERYTERELIRFDPGDQNGTAVAQGLIHSLAELTDEQKAFTHFWSGYFYAQAGMSDPETDLRDRAPNRGALADDRQDH